MNVAAIVIIVLLAAALFGAWTLKFERGPCPRCKGRGRGRWSRPRAFNHRCRCGGSGERIRPLSLVWARHRKEARRMRDEVRRRRESR
jgi:hypothetical protein